MCEGDAKLETHSCHDPLHIPLFPHAPLSAQHKVSHANRQKRLDAACADEMRAFALRLKQPSSSEKPP